MRTEPPEMQWINIQKAKKEKELNEARKLSNAEAKCGRDLILDVVMHSMQEGECRGAERGEGRRRKD
jgi:hypothetical protein